METRKSGPSGGTGGDEFVDQILPQDDRVVEVHIHTQERVNGIQIIHETIDGCRHPFPLHGRAAGVCEILRLDADEFMVRISGRFGAHVDSIRIHTNKRVLPLLGREDGGGVYVYEALPGTEIVGFCGRAGSRLDAIGVILRRRGL
jgi:hypothetical protein